MDLIYNVARRAVPCGEDAEDLVQETYLLAYRSWLGGTRPRKVEPWLVTICLNSARSRHRRRSRRPLEVPLEAAAFLESRADPEAEVLVREDQRRVHSAMWGLPESQRIAIALVDLAGLSIVDAARAMGTPRGTVLSRLHRGRRALAVSLGEAVREYDA